MMIWKSKHIPVLQPQSRHCYLHQNFHNTCIRKAAGNKRKVNSFVKRVWAERKNSFVWKMSTTKSFYQNIKGIFLELIICNDCYCFPGWQKKCYINPPVFCPLTLVAVGVSPSEVMDFSSIFSSLCSSSIGCFSFSGRFSGLAVLCVTKGATTIKDAFA